jgi:hypothetical protein
LRQPYHCTASASSAFAASGTGLSLTWDGFSPQFTYVIYNMNQPDPAITYAQVISLEGNASCGQSDKRGLYIPGIPPIPPIPGIPPIPIFLITQSSDHSLDNSHSCVVTVVVEHESSENHGFRSWLYNFATGKTLNLNFCWRPQLLKATLPFYSWQPQLLKPTLKS